MLRLLLAAQGGASFTPPPSGLPDTLGNSLTKQGIVISRNTAAWNYALIESPMVWYDTPTSQFVLIAVGYEAGSVNAAVGVYTASSADGPWTEYAGNPILAKSAVGGSVDENGISGPFVLYESGTYYLFYIGLTGVGYEAGTKAMAIASSTDWVPGSNAGTWTRHGAIISPTTGWRGAAIWHPDVFKVGSTYYNFFNANGPTERIGYATASAPLGPWTPDDVNSPVVSEGTGWEASHVGDPSVYRTATLYRMAYYGYTPDVACDGIADCALADFPVGPWVKYSGNPVLSPGPGTYDGGYAHKPFIYIDESIRRLYHFYTAVGSGGRQIALATEDY